jgi:hypothetical protein
MFTGNDFLLQRVHENLYAMVVIKIKKKLQMETVELRTQGQQKFRFTAQ